MRQSRRPAMSDLFSQGVTYERTLTSGRLLMSGFDCRFSRSSQHTLQIAQLVFQSQASCAVVQSPVSGRDYDAHATEYVSYGDLDLGTNIGQIRLNHRLQAAASRLCIVDNRASPTSYIDTRCFRASMAQAREQMGHIIARTASAAGSSPVIALNRSAR